MPGGTDGFDVPDLDNPYGFPPGPYNKATKIVSIIPGHELRDDVRETDSFTPVNLELSLHSRDRSNIIVPNLENKLKVQIDPKSLEWDFLPKPITLWERTILDPNEDPNDPNNYTISFLADVRDANDKQGGTGTATIPLADLNGTYGSEVPYMYAQLRFNTFPGDFDLHSRVDMRDFAILANDWNATDVNSVADISGPNGLPDKNVDYWDLALFSGDYLKDSNDPNTYSKLTPKINGVNVLDGEHLKAFQNSSRKLFGGRKEPLYAKEEKEAV